MLANKTNITGRRIRLSREALGWTQADLAVRAGLDYVQADVTICRYETGRVEPRLFMLRAICKALKVSGDYLLGLEDVHGEAEISD